MQRLVASLLVLLPAFTGPVAAREGLSPAVPTFERDIQPILTRHGCNAGPCHGKARGQNGFALSLFAYDHDFDHNSLFGQARGRRVNPEAPDDSILLRKAVASMAHGGGRKLTTDHPHYEVLKAWIRAGGPRTPKESPSLVKISVSPDRRLLEPRATQTLGVVAHWADGTTSDVTSLALFSSS